MAEILEVPSSEVSCDPIRRRWAGERVLTNEDLAAEFPDWTVAKIAGKTGIYGQHIAADDEFSSDLAIGAVCALQRDHGVDLTTIDHLIVVTHTLDHPMPAVSSIMHGALGLPSDCGTVELALGCSVHFSRGHPRSGVAHLSIV